MATRPFERGGRRSAACRLAWLPGGRGTAGAAPRGMLRICCGGVREMQNAKEISMHFLAFFYI